MSSCTPPPDMDACWQPGETRVEAEARIRRACRDTSDLLDDAQLDIEAPTAEEPTIVDLAPYLQHLPKKQQTILRLLYGLEHGTERSQEQVAAILNISRSHLCVQKRQALATLRSLFYAL